MVAANLNGSRYFVAAKVIFEEARQCGLKADESGEAIAKKYFAKDLRRGDLV
jgi:hypothetical protein